MAGLVIRQRIVNAGTQNHIGHTPLMDTNNKEYLLTKISIMLKYKYWFCEHLCQWDDCRKCHYLKKRISWIKIISYILIFVYLLVAGYILACLMIDDLMTKGR